MKKHVLSLALGGAVVFISACNIGLTATPVPRVIESPALSLNVQVQNPTDIFDTVGDEIRYNYGITNAGSESFAGPVAVNDNIATVTCPAVTTVGDLDNELDSGESISCTGTYSITQAALDAGTVTNIATASLGGGTVLSTPSSTTVTLTPIPAKTLGLAKTANPQTYSYTGQPITYTYVITNTGSVAIGPAQFMITDDRLGGSAAPFACGPANSALNPAGTLTCQATYLITQQDMGATTVTNTAIASGGDAQASSPASATISNTIYLTPEVGGPSNLTPGSTIQHIVEKGEWLIQIARCYGVSYESLRKSNLHIANPSIIDPGLVVTVPNIGSAGTIYGKPCVVYHTVAAGDTWESLAARYNARIDVLQEVNPGGLVAGTVIKIAINSAGGGPAQVPVTGGPTSTFTPTVTPTVTPMVTNTPTVTPTLGTVVPGTGQPTRIVFPAGSTSASVSNTIIGSETDSYLVAATQGQSMTVNVIAPVNEVAIRITDPSGFQIKQLDGNLIWAGPLSATGDYRIDLVGLTAPNKNYTLTVTMTGP